MGRPSLRQVRSIIKKEQRVIPAKQLRKVVNAQCKTLGIARPKMMRVWDGDYNIISLAAWKMLLAWSWVDKFQYVADRRDCDDYAKYLWGQVPMRLKVNGIGLVCDYSGGHAYNVVVTFEGDGPPILAFVEPQTDQFVAVGDQLTQTEIYALENWEVYF